MRKRTQRILSWILAIVMVVGLSPRLPLALSAEATREEPVIVIAGSDLQASTHEAGTANALAIIDAMKADGYTDADGFLFAGDYSTVFTVEKSKGGKTALQEAMQTAYPDLSTDSMVWVQGNHDDDSLTTDGTLSTSGAHDTDDYGVYVIHEKDYMWLGVSDIYKAAVQETAAALDDYLEEKIAGQYSKPIFVVSHLPLHYSMRTPADATAMHANYIFDVLNHAGARGLNIIFLFGHDHNNGWDDYLGGSSIYLAKGDSINIAQSSRTEFKTETLNFTYMNAGYIGYYSGVNSGSDRTLTMTVYEITSDQVTISRYCADGTHDLKSAGVTNSYKNETAYPPDTRVYASTQTLQLNRVYTDGTSGVTVSGVGISGLTVTAGGTQVSDTYRAYKTYDIQPTGLTGENSAAVTIPVDSSFDPSLSVLVLDHQNKQVIPARIVDGVVTFHTDHPGQFTVAQANTEPVSASGTVDAYLKRVTSLEAGVPYVISDHLKGWMLTAQAGSNGDHVGLLLDQNRSADHIWYVDADGKVIYGTADSSDYLLVAYQTDTTNGNVTIGAYDATYATSTRYSKSNGGFEIFNATTDKEYLYCKNLVATAYDKPSGSYWTFEQVLTDQLLHLTVTPSQDTVFLGSTAALDVSVTVGDEAVSKYELTWESADSTIATVSQDGIVTPVGEGTARLRGTLTAVGGLPLEESVTVEVTIQVTLHPAEAFSGKTISILGASISTYTGISNNTDYNSTIGSNAVYYTEGRHGVYASDTWWMQAANDLGLRLLVNNSWSGSSLLYERNGTVGAYVDRCVQLHNNEGEEPDIIAIQMGTNDFQYYKDTLGTADIDYAALITENTDGTYAYATPVTSLEATAIVLHKISVRYPSAEVYYLNISQRIDGTDELIRSFNAELKQVVEHFGAHIVDIYGSAITMDTFGTYIADNRVHPNKLGMDAYTEAFKRALIVNTAYGVDTHTVFLELDGVTASYGDDKIVVSGDSFNVDLTASDSLQVTVTMGDQDITSSAYADGSVTIDSVTADVTVTAKSVRVPHNYRWEFDGTDLASTDGSNPLTKTAGTTTDGVFSNTAYTLASAVVLRHDEPWVVEWKCEGTFMNTNGSTGARIFTSDNVNANYNARYIFKSNKNGIIAMGEKTTTGSHNYGIALADQGIDWTALHTYRLENRIAADGSNMIYLYVDGTEIGPMNHYYIGTADQGTVSNWLSGKDFTFPYMGTDTHGFTNASIEYIQVLESHTHAYTASLTAPTCTEQGYTTYTCTTCGDSYVADFVDATGHSYTNGICTACEQMDTYTALDAFEYTTDTQAQTVTLTKYIGTDTAVIVPAYYVIDGIRCTPVLQSQTVFSENTSITAVTLRSGVRFADDTMYRLFAGCSKLTTVDMTGVDTSYVTSFRELFSLCKNLTNVYGYEEWDTGHVESIFKAFNYVQNMSAIDLSRWDLSQVTNSGWCFQYCYAKTILLPDNLAVISSGFLNHAAKVTGSTFTIPVGVKKIGYGHTIYDFATDDFVEFIVAEGNTFYQTIDGILYSMDGTELLAIPRGKTFENGVYEIPEGVTFLGELSFSRNLNITKVILPDSFVIEFVAPRDDRYVVYEDIGNLNIGTNLTIAIYTFVPVQDYEVKASNPNYTCVDGIIYSKDMTTVVAIPTRYGRRIHIPEGVTTWNKQAMWNDTEVSDLYANNTVDTLLSACGGIDIPSTLVSIDEDQLGLINRLKYKFGDSFVIAVHECNPVYCLDAEGYLRQHSYESGVCTICGAKIGAPAWEQGTISSATGLNNANTTRLRTVDYLNISDFGAVAIDLGYTMTAFVYDADHNYLGTTSWLGNGVTLWLADLQSEYPDSVYFRIALRALDSSTLTVADTPDTGVTFYVPGEDVPAREGDLKYEDVGTVGFWQDGAIWDSKLFVLGSSGTGAVYDLETMTKLGSVTLDKSDVLKPHANSVCFGSSYYAEEDKYPLLYVNVYNNYANAEDRMEGVCCVYRITESSGVFTTQLVQVIRIGFVEDLTLWKSMENNGDVRPYGNFVVDTDNRKLYAFVMRDADQVTRFFCFDIPTLTAGTYSETYGCNVVTLESTDIERQFDTEYFCYLQGCTYTDGKIISAEGFNSGGSAEPALRIVDLSTGTVIKTYEPAASNLLKEPEVVCADPVTGIVYYAAADGILRVLTLPEIHTHTYESTVTAPTCTELGYTTYTCTTCGDSYVDDYVSALGHRYTAEVTAPTCTEAGYTTYTCTTCGDSYVADYVDASGHSLGQWYITKAATCTEEGMQQRDCVNCDYCETEPIPETGHSYTTAVTAPTCTEQGYTTYTCACGDSYVGDYVDANGHSLGQWYTTKAATCTEEGTQQRDCVNCDYCETELIPETGHSYTTAVTAPTCTEQGYTTYTCHCGDSYVGDYVEASGHSLGQWYTIKAATCTEDGVQQRDCVNCDYCETEPIPETGHSYASVVSAPTCTEQGYTNYTCHCGDSYVADYVDALGHTAGNEILENVTEDGGYDLVVHCSACGTELSCLHIAGYIPGDINGDGEVNNKDLTRLFQYLSGYDVFVVERALDTNGDGEVNNKDLTRLFQYLSDYDVELAKPTVPAQDADIPVDNKKRKT